MPLQVIQKHWGWQTQIHIANQQTCSFFKLFQQKQMLVVTNLDSYMWRIFLFAAFFKSKNRIGNAFTSKSMLSTTSTLFFIRDTFTGTLARYREKSPKHQGHKILGEQRILVWRPIFLYLLFGFRTRFVIFLRRYL